MTLMSWLPRGSSMSAESWQRRHTVLGFFLRGSVPILLIVGLIGPMPAVEVVVLPLLVSVAAVLGAILPGQAGRSNATSLGLIGASFAGIELSGGQLHAHLYILSAVALVALYQQWSPLLVTVGAVVGHHLAFGLLAPERVMSMGDGMLGHTSLWGVVAMVASHAVAVVVEVVAILLWWHFAEISERESRELSAQVDTERQELDRHRIEASAAESAAQFAHMQEQTAWGDGLADEALRIQAYSQEAAGAVLALEQQSAMLGTAVHEIAQRCQEAAQTASNGQETTQAAAAQVQRLEEAMAEIADVNTMIGQLAAQTNLLSLNATIEAARAGEMGKGFGVVAQEVKALATATAASADKVRGVVEGVVGETRKVAQSFRTTNELVGMIGSAQTDIAASVEEQAAVLAEVSRQTTVAADAGRQVSDALERMINTPGSR